MRRLTFALALLSLLAVTLPACSSAHKVSLHMMPLGQMPAAVQRAPLRVREAYQFSAANREVAESAPCYCGCVNLGHKSSYDCYVAETYESGALIFDEHALGCEICVDITQDVMRLLREGQSTPDIASYINHSYSKLGAPTVR